MNQNGILRIGKSNLKQVKTEQDELLFSDRNGKNIDDDNNSLSENEYSLNIKDGSSLRTS